METPNLQERAPIVVVLGHVDHGKSTLLDYIRNTNVVATESGGITQKVSAYEVEKTHEGRARKITFLDTPGHEAFGAIRSRGAKIADIAILVVSSEDGVKPQTKEAYNAIKQSGIPCVVALSKIDKPNADINRAKISLSENEIFVEGFGGDIPAVPISAKTGEGISDLLDTLLLVADIADLKFDTNTLATGNVLESVRNAKTGIGATLLIKDGVLNINDYIWSGDAIAPVRAIFDSRGKKISSARASQPIIIYGFDSLPKAGNSFLVFKTKKESENEREKQKICEEYSTVSEDERFALPLIIKAEAIGSIEAIKHECEKIENEFMRVKILRAEIGNISEDDLRLAEACENAVIVGFNVGVDNIAKEISENIKIPIAIFSIIYELAEHVRVEADSRRPRSNVEEELGVANIIKRFSEKKNIFTIGGKVLRGTISVGDKIRLERKGVVLARGTIETMQVNKVESKSASEGSMFGSQIVCDEVPKENDTIVAYKKAQK